MGSCLSSESTRKKGGRYQRLCYTIHLRHEDGSRLLTLQQDHGIWRRQDVMSRVAEELSRRYGSLLPGGICTVLILVPGQDDKASTFETSEPVTDVHFRAHFW
jgi:hypothetical protein